jgi:EmrB/QacA subfamily drug resistance transporter
MTLILETNHKWWIVIAMSTMMFMLNLDLTIVNLALPAISHELHTSLSELQWVINGYVLTCAMFTVMGGKLGDTYGHRGIFLIGVIIFTIASATAGFAHDEWTLIISRLGQGFGAALSFPLIMVIIFAAVPERQKGMALGIMATTIGIAQAIGPSLGGVIIKFLNWHWIFFVNIPIGIFTIFLTLIVCPRYILAITKESIDYKGATLLAISLFFVLLALNEAQNWGLFSQLFLSCFFTGIILLVLFIFIEAKIRRPFINLNIFTNKMFSAVSFVRATAAYSFFMILFFIVLYLQNIKQHSALFAGLLLLFLTITFGALSSVCGAVIDKVGARGPLLFGTLLLTIIFLALTQLGILPIYILALLLFFLGLCLSILLTGTNVIALSVVPKQQIGAASGVFFTIALIGCMFGIAISGTIMAMRSSHYLTQQLLLNNIHVPQTKMHLLTLIANGSHSLTRLVGNFTPAMAQKLSPILEHSFLHAFFSVALVCAGLAIISFLLTLFAKGYSK